ncbi:MAG: hypothetical protein QM724_13860 [Flavobacteriales bacterium]
MILSCDQPPTAGSEKIIQGTVDRVENEHSVLSDTVTSLLIRSLKTDTLEFEGREPFIFFKSGYFLSGMEKNAIVVQCPTDSTYTLKLYSIKDNTWILSDSVNGLDAFPIQFRPVFDDYNFDGITDIYIQATASNGYSMSRGDLMTIDPSTKKLEVHQEARELANMKPDKKIRSVLSEEAIECGSDLTKAVGIWTNKWINGRLTTIKKDYPCEPLR